MKGCELADGRIRIRTTNLADRSFVEERAKGWRPGIPVAWGRPPPLAAAESLLDDCPELRLDLAAQLIRTPVELLAELHQLGLSPAQNRTSPAGAATRAAATGFSTGLGSATSLPRLATASLRDAEGPRT